jgi:DNA invertase Pin-like site-specific DNA recombinase
MTVVQGIEHDEPRRAGLYERVSRRNGRDADALERTTLDEQLSYARAIVPQASELVVDRKRWLDVDISGATQDRPGLQQLFDDVRSGYIDDVVVGYLSRLGRSMIDVLANVKTLRDLGATIYFGREGLTIRPVDPSGTTTVILAVFAGVAEMERDRLREGLKRANANARERGVSIQVPYGYRRSNGPGSPLAFDERDAFGKLPEGDELISTTPADVVRDIFARRLQGVGCSDIAHELNAASIPTPTMLEHLRGERKQPGAKLWRHNAIVSLVATHTYKGVIPVGVAFEGEGKRKRATAWELVPGDHPALVSDDDWTDAQSSGRATRNGSTGDALLQGLVRCETCSRTMKPSKAGGNGRKLLTYVCPNSDCERSARIPRAGVDAYVVEQLLEGAIVHEHELETQRAELEKARRDVETATAEYDVFVSRSGALAADVFARGNAQHRLRLEQAQRRLSALEARATPNLAETLHDFADLELDDQRDVLDALLDAVVIRPAPGRGRSGVVSERVVLIPKGTAPFELSGTGKIVAARRWPL